MEDNSGKNNQNENKQEITEKTSVFRAKVHIESVFQENEELTKTSRIIEKCDSSNRLLASPSPNVGFGVDGNSSINLTFKQEEQFDNQIDDHAMVTISTVTDNIRGNTASPDRLAHENIRVEASISIQNLQPEIQNTPFDQNKSLTLEIDFNNCPYADYNEAKGKSESFKEIELQKSQESQNPTGLTHNDTEDINLNTSTQEELFTSANTERAFENGIMACDISKASCPNSPAQTISDDENYSPVISSMKIKHNNKDELISPRSIQEGLFNSANKERASKRDMFNGIIADDVSRELCRISTAITLSDDENYSLMQNSTKLKHNDTENLTTSMKEELFISANTERAATNGIMAYEISKDSCQISTAQTISDDENYSPVISSMKIKHNNEYTIISPRSIKEGLFSSANKERASKRDMFNGIIADDVSRELCRISTAMTISDDENYSLVQNSTKIKHIDTEENNLIKSLKEELFISANTERALTNGIIAYEISKDSCQIFTAQTISDDENYSPVINAMKIKRSDKDALISSTSIQKGLFSSANKERASKRDMFNGIIADDVSKVLCRISTAITISDDENYSLVQNFAKIKHNNTGEVDFGSSIKGALFTSANTERALTNNIVTYDISKDSCHISTAQTISDDENYNTIQKSTIGQQNYHKGTILDGVMQDGLFTPANSERAMTNMPSSLSSRNIDSKHSDLVLTTPVNFKAEENQDTNFNTVDKKTETGNSISVRLFDGTVDDKSLFVTSTFERSRNDGKPSSHSHDVSYKYHRYHRKNEKGACHRSSSLSSREVISKCGANDCPNISVIESLKMTKNMLSSYISNQQGLGQSDEVRNSLFSQCVDQLENVIKNNSETRQAPDLETAQSLLISMNQVMEMLARNEVAPLLEIQVNICNHDL